MPAAHLLLVALAACDAAPSEQVGPQEKPPQVAAAVRTAALAPARFPPKIEGSASIINPNALIQSDADLRAAKIAAEFSKSQLDRAETLFKSHMTVSKQTLENAERQANTDAVQVALQENRQRAEWGDEAPFLSDTARHEVVAKLSAATTGIVRIDFPGGLSGQPRNAEVFPLSGGQPSPVDVLWPAPSGNLAMPGVSYFGLVASGPGLRTGDRARFTADMADANGGIVVPNSAIVIQGGEAWCYVETDDGKFERKRVPLEHTADQGYLVYEGFESGEKVVVQGAAMLLAREAEGEEQKSAERAHP